MARPAVTGSKASKRREDLRTQLAPECVYWIPKKQAGWFKGPRSLPLIVRLLETKKLKGGRARLGAVYLELLSRHIDEGIIEMSSQEEHAWSAGFWSTRAQRDWRDHMKVLEDLGFIESYPVGSMKYGYVVLVHPVVVINRLKEKKKLPTGWWDQYRTRQIRLGEPSHEEVMA